MLSFTDKGRDCALLGFTVTNIKSLLIYFFFFFCFLFFFFWICMCLQERTADKEKFIT